MSNRRIPLSANFQLRTHQEEIIKFQKGWMGISAVPGSGKTWTLSLLASEIISRGVLINGQEILVVTLVNSAVDNFYQRVREFLRGQGILPMGFRVRTLHGLAHDIVRERPGLVGLANNFQIIEERDQGIILGDVAQTWMKSHPNELDEWLSPDVDDKKFIQIKRKDLPDLIKEVAIQFIRTAKDWQLTPEEITRKLTSLPIRLPLVEMGAAMFTDYQLALAYRGAVDFDDLIRLALLALKSDPLYLDRLRNRWPIILEDEAQDSSRLQEEILRLLSGVEGNWVRVGDPNQAIYETFTTASPKYLIDFINQPGVQRKQLPVSGRSTESIINMANELVKWTIAEHPINEVRDALVAPPYIKPTEPDDPHPNPYDDPSKVVLVENRFSPIEEIVNVVKSLKKWLPDHQGHTVAVLVPRNQRGIEISNVLKKEGIETIELLSSTSQTRKTVDYLVNILLYLSEPNQVRKLEIVFQDWSTCYLENEISASVISEVTARLKKLNLVEDFLWPGPDFDWFNDQKKQGDFPEVFEVMELFRKSIKRWQSAAGLPIDQLLLVISQDLFRKPHELALAYKLSVLLRRAGQENSQWSLSDSVRELQLISKNERKMLGFSQDDLGFNPENHPGKVVVATIHRAKGLEWDRVYLLSVNDYDFPTYPDAMQFIAEKWFVREKLNLGAETLSQFQACFNPDEWEWYEPGRATMNARLDYIRERIRLFYVGITRAKKELIITWNSGRKGDVPASAPFIALVNYQKSMIAQLENLDETSG